MKNLIRLIMVFFLTGQLILIQGCKKESEIPELSTFPVFELTTTTAETGGNVTSGGADAVHSRGLCWNTSPNPTVNDNMISGGAGTGPFLVKLNDLEPDTKYFIRAFALNKYGRAYGNEISFVTRQASLPGVGTDTVTLITSTSAVTGGFIFSNGGIAVNECGICYSTSPNPTWENSTIYDMTSESGWTGAFTCVLSGLNPGTVYFIRSFAINKMGTSYGGERSFKTKN
jgi:hypothetical protein